MLGKLSMIGAVAAIIMIPHSAVRGSGPQRAPVRPAFAGCDGLEFRFRFTPEANRERDDGVSALPVRPGRVRSAACGLTMCCLPPLANVAGCWLSFFVLLADDLLARTGPSLQTTAGSLPLECADHSDFDAYQKTIPNSRFAGSMKSSTSAIGFGVVEPYWKVTGSQTIDNGRADVTKNPDDLYVFRVASLRNVAMTAPYFHDGSVAALPEAVRVMARV
jgi:hypothetical protein